MKLIEKKDLRYDLHNILVAVTTEPDYEMERDIMLESYDGATYTHIKGFHCSCYDFDETDWQIMEYSIDEIRKLANAPYNQDDMFWKLVREQVGSIKI